MENNKINKSFQFAALNPFVVENLPKPTEIEVSGRDFVAWGDGNSYPNYLFELFSNVTTLQTIINGTADYVCGENITINKASNFINKKGETIEDIINKIVVDYLIYGGFAVQIIKNSLNQINEIYWIDFSKLRSNADNSILFYSDDWSKSYGRVRTIKYPKYSSNDENPTSIYYFKGSKTRSTYPLPLYNAAITCCETQRKIDTFHLNEINNNFLTSKIINFNNGIPDDNLKEEIEKNINEKFSGAENAGRILLTFNQSQDTAPTVIDLSTDDYDKRYEELAKRTREQIYCAFRAIPALFGVNPEDTGFSLTEYQEAFKVFNKTVIKPIQKLIKRSFEYIYNEEDIINIEPFKLDDEDNNSIVK